MTIEELLRKLGAKTAANVTLTRLRSHASADEHAEAESNSRRASEQGKCGAEGPDGVALIDASLAALLVKAGAKDRR